MVNRPPGREPPQKATLRCEQGGPLAVLVTSHHRLGRDFGGRKAHHRQDLSSGSVHPRGSTTFAVDSRSRQAANWVRSRDVTPFARRRTFAELRSLPRPCLYSQMLLEVIMLHFRNVKPCAQRPVAR